MNYIQIIITIVITAIITHFLTLCRERKQWNRTLELQKIQDYNKAAAVFRSAFTETLHKLKKKLGIPYELLHRACPLFEKAMMQFKPYLSDHELKSLDATWKEFFISEKYSPQDLLQYNSHNRDERANLRKLAIQRIEKLLKCANPK